MKLHRVLHRCWFNQPSRLHQCHKLHGVNVLADINNDDPNDCCRVYFTSGTVISGIYPKRSLSKGWNE